MQSPVLPPPGIADILQQQLELQREILRSQQRSVELQEQLIAALRLGQSELGQATAQCTGPDVPFSMTGPRAAGNSAPPLPDLNVPEQPQAADLNVPSGEGAGDQKEANEDEEETLETRKLRDFLDKYDVEPDGIPWLVAPSSASFCDVLKISMCHHFGDLAVCFPDRSTFFEAAEAAMSPGRFKDFLVTSLELRLLFQSLLLSITVPASLSQPTPKTSLDLVISVFTFLLGVLNTIGVCLCIFATGILSSVSVNNFTAWLHANYRFVHAALSSQCAMVPMVLFLQAASQIRTQLSVDWLGTITQRALCGVQIAMIMSMMTAMLFATNAAGRTAAFSGAMGDAAVPAMKSIFSSTLGGNKVGILGMKKYLSAVKDNDKTQSVKKKSLFHRQATGQKKIDIRKFDMSVF